MVIKKKQINWRNHEKYLETTLNFIQVGLKKAEVDQQQLHNARESHERTDKKSWFTLLECKVNKMQENAVCCLSSPV